MLSAPGRSAARRIASVRYPLPRPPGRVPPSIVRSVAARSPSQYTVTRLPQQRRGYASGKVHPPGGTHRMNLGGEPEKAALEQYGIDLTEKAKAGKLDP
ncbi:chaperone ATPase hsp78, partial [Teratosphaeriaceae sp. CCFEE 6253]